LKLGTSLTSATCIYIIIYESFKGGSGIESCGITWKSEEEFLKLGTSTTCMYLTYDTLRWQWDRVLRYYLEVRGGILEVGHFHGDEENSQARSEAASSR
jgi:hypothetical protein